MGFIVQLQLADNKLNVPASFWHRYLTPENEYSWSNFQTVPKNVVITALHYPKRKKKKNPENPKLTSLQAEVSASDRAFFAET